MVVLIVSALGLAVGSLIWAALDRPVRLGHLVAGAAVEILLLVQGVIAVIRVIGGTRPASVPTFLAYAAGSLLVLPIAVMWALEERTRWSSVVLAVAAATLAVIVLRMNIVWNTRG
ncbi:MAG TPA: hypothetical protein VLR26_11680 [Frankiaceae bacterium]|nr:hypothetical protein [Frankiaceae bacterium]